MGTPYQGEYAVGSLVQIASRSKLQAFKADWKYHNPLQPEQLKHAGQICEVAAVGFYHGGDVLYQLSNVPGVWHEACLEPYVATQ